MNLWESVRSALAAIMAHKMRSILTMLGIIIGVAAVITVVAIGQGAKEMLISQISPDNTLDVFYNRSDEAPDVWMQSAFTQEDVRLLEDIPEVTGVITSSTEYGPIRYRDQQMDVDIRGINQAYLNANELKVQNGGTLRAADFLGGRRVALVTQSIQEELFEDENAVGEFIRIARQPVEIIGVTESAGLFDLGLQEVYLPWDTWRTLYGSSGEIEVKLQASRPDDLHKVGEQAVDLLNARYNTDAYEVMNFKEITEDIDQKTSIMTLVIGSIAGISLVVGGIGVMNIMLASVTERTREIGIRKALGATRQQILFQFLIESIMLTLIGGTIGIGLGYGGAALVSIFAGGSSLVAWPVLIGGLLFSMIIGVIFGILPANKAARLDPIESIRYE